MGERGGWWGILGEYVKFSAYIQGDFRRGKEPYLCKSFLWYSVHVTLTSLENLKG